MKKISYITAPRAITSLIICPVGFLFAIDPSMDISSPPTAIQEDRQAQNRTTPFLGLATAEIPDLLASHLGIDRNSGVLIRTVCPDSPAAAAGLNVNDIITHFDGEKMSHPDAFSAKIRNYKMGDSVSLDLISKGQIKSINVKLAERPAEFEAHLGAEPFLNGLPKNQADHLRDLMAQNGMNWGMGLEEFLNDAQMDSTFRMMRQQMNQAFERTMPPQRQNGQSGFQFQQNSTLRLMDQDGSVEIRKSGQHTQAIVRDMNNKINWEGPWNTDEDKALAPPDIKQRIDSVNIGSANERGFSFQFKSR